MQRQVAGFPGGLPGNPVSVDRRSNDKTNGSALILGNSGQGKSYLMKLLLTNFRESGKAVICLDVEEELLLIL